MIIQLQLINKHQKTVTVKEHKKEVEIDKTPIKLRLIDCPGLQVGEEISIKEISKAHIVVGVYDFSGNKFIN